jgi:hypothetical protein
MKFIIFVCPTGDPAPDAELDAATDAWVAEHDADGTRVIGEVLDAEASGAVVGLPAPASTDFIGGFDVLECADLDEAVAIAEAHPMSKRGAIVIRPFLV